MNIRYATKADFDLIAEHEKPHNLDPQLLMDCIEHGYVMIAEVDGAFVGWLRYGYFWDIVPFMNMLHFNEDQRGKGYGRQMTLFWEDEMRKKGHKNVMTSSQSDEYAQHFYVKLGYRAIGGFMLEGDPLEIVFEKAL